MTQPKLELFDDDHSLFCAKVKLALYAKRLHFESLAVPCGTTESPEFQRISPLGKIPVLRVTDEGQQPVLLFESEVIIEWLEERFPAPAHPALMPEQPLLRAQARLIARFHDLSLEPALRKLYAQVAPSTRDPVYVKAVVKELQEMLDKLEELVLRGDALLSSFKPPQAQPGPSSVSESGSPPKDAYDEPDPQPTLHRLFPLGFLSLADCAYPAAFLYLDIILDALRGVVPAGLTWPSRIQAWKVTLDNDKRVQAVLHTLRPAALGWLWAKVNQ